jgi:hypothetical protein
MDELQDMMENVVSWSLDVNEHRRYYEDIDISDPSEWTDPSHMLAAIDNNSCYVLQWYPLTPIGFHVVKSNSFENLMNYMKRGVSDAG